MTTSYAQERRVVLRRLAEYLGEALVNDYEWLNEEEDSTEPLDEFARRRRRKAAEAVKRYLEDRGREP